MKKLYKVFRTDVKDITRYYMILVNETRSQRLVGSTNEWVLDNYYMISEQEKLMVGELKGVENGEWKVESGGRVEVLWRLLDGFVERSHCEVDKALLFRYLRQVQQREKDYLSYPEVTALLPLMKALLINKLAILCRELESEGAQHYRPTEKPSSEGLESAARQNLRMMNIFNSLKKMTKLPMAELIDAVSFSERMLKDEKAGMYDQMQDKTKEDYRARIVRICRKGKVKEYDLVKKLVESDEHVGWALFPPKRWKVRARLYIWIIVLASWAGAAAVAWVTTNCDLWIKALMTVLLAVPVSQVAIDLFNWLLGKLHKPQGTFKLKFKDGLVPDPYATMVIMPTILKSREKVEELMGVLEMYYLSNINRGEGKVESGKWKVESGKWKVESANKFNNIYYTLVGDAASYKEADAPWDEEVSEAGLRMVKELNEKYGAPIFNFVYRRRAWSEGEQTWLGHERKRGAILHFNDLLLGQTTEEEKQKRFRTETVSRWRAESGKWKVESGESPIRFVITLDTDTELVLYSAQKLIGAMAHPLNVAQLSKDGKRVERGYGIMQPRVNVDVEVTNKSRYAQLMAGLGGLDVYTTASFELYQDIFNEGSFCGKGIYDLRVFQQVLKGTFPENLILSHDLLEGCHIRCGLINDVEVFDDNPSNYIDDAKRHHRWTRGDWQIISWLTPHVRNERGQRVKNQVNTIGRWKIFDNLRRSMLSLSVMLMVFAGYALAIAHGTRPSPAWFLLVAAIVVASPIVFFIVGQVTKLPRFGRRYKYYMTLMRGFRVIVYRSVVQFALLPKEAWMYTDAAVRACWRMWVSKHHLLAWITSDEAAKSTKGTLGDYVKKFWFNYVAAVVLILITCQMLDNTSDYIPTGDIVAAVFAAIACAVWVAAPFVMYRLGKKFPQERKTLSEQETTEVLQLAKDTWHFFDTLLTEETHWLIPDNYQVGREPLTDYKTSPTNIGFSLTAVVSADTLGFISHEEAVKRIGYIMDTVETLEKWNGHLYNWYDIHSLRKLPNFFVSTADSGNFVACLYVVKGWLETLDGAARGEDTDALLSKVQRLIEQTDFSKLYNPELDVFSIGYDDTSHTLLPYHYNNFASEARLTSFLTIAQGDAPYKHWFCLDKTLVQYKGYKGVASWYGTMFEYFMPLIFLPTYRHTLMDETYSFAIRAQRAFNNPWGISETAYNELDDARNYKYHAFGVPYLKFQNTTPDRIVISPYSSLLAISADDRAVYNNMQALKQLDMTDEYGFFESYDDEDHVTVKAHYAHHQGMILASLTNYLQHNRLQHLFMQAPVMQSMETLLKEKAQVKPYIDLKVTQYKRYQYSKVQTESDARDFDGIANVPEIGVVSNGEYTVMVNDRGSGFSRYKNIMLNRYRKISADHYGTFLFVRNLATDALWSATYAPLDVMPSGYHVSFASDKIKFSREDDGIVTQTEITVLKDRSAELRRFTFTNHTPAPVDLELTSYGEVVLAPAAEDESHRVFAAMKVLSEYDAEHQALLFNRPGTQNTRNMLLHRLWVDGASDRVTESLSDRATQTPLVEYETSRMNFLGRGGSLRHADIMESRRTLTGTVGTTLDPVFSMRRRLHVEPGMKAEAYVLTAFGKAREQLLQLSGQYQSALDVEHAFKTASVFNNMRTSLSLLKGSQMQLYASLAKYMAQTATLGNDRNALLSQNTLSQSGLWRFGISGDLAIILLEIDSMERSGFAKELLRAFEYYKVHGLLLDLVFINDAPEGERDALTHFILGMANTEHLWATHSDAGKVYVLNGSDISDAERTLLRVVARLSFSTAEGITIAQQLRRLEVANQHYQDKVEYPVLRPKRDFRVWSDLEFYNQYGGFDGGVRDRSGANQSKGNGGVRDRSGANQSEAFWTSDYVVTNTNTPMPWINVIANEHHFGCIVSSTMAGFTFAHNAQQFKLTGWSNDIVRDNASEMLLINRRQFLPATARHSQGWSAFDADYDDGLAVKVRTFVSIDKPEKYYQIKVNNGSTESRQVQLDMVYKLVLGMCEEETARYLHSEWDEQSNSLLVRNVYHPIYHDHTLRLSCTEKLTDISMHYPNRKRLGLLLSLAPGEEKELAFIIASYRVTESQSDSVATQSPSHPATQPPSHSATQPPSHPATQPPSHPATQPLSHPATLDTIYAEFDHVVAYWDEKLSHIQVETPDRALNHMLNRWYLYQVYASRLFARAGFYQVGGATGFRDQLQDVMSLLYSDPEYARRQILDHAAHQFPEGDVLHWWHESMKLGARTTFSDDYLWLLFVTHQYVRVTGDHSILSEPVPFCHAEPLAPGEAERGMHYECGKVTESATLYDHLRRAVDRALSRIGRHGLPLMGCGDWNDGMSAVGVGGKGESVWVAFFLCDLLPKMEELTVLAGKMPALQADLSYCQHLHDARIRLVDALQANTWDGNWFLRAFFDNGDPMGSRNNIECQIDLITQAWSILTDVATPEQKQSVLRETDRRLVNREHEIIQLLTPAFKDSNPSPGYIMNYPVGLRENGGQYTHGAMWYIMAKLKEGQRDEAYYLYSIINPVHRTHSLADVLKYKVEPYCMAADIYSNPQHPGRGGWTWYTGSASWAYKTGIENILGLHKQGDTIVLDPRVPTEWPSFSLRYRFGQSMYTIRYTRPNPTQPLSHSATQPLSHSIPLVDDGKEHEILI